MRVLAIDLGAKPGFCFTIDGVLAGVGWDAPVTATDLDELVVEAQFAAAHIFRDGKRVRVSRGSQQTLSFTAGRLFERFPATRKYRIQPDAWRGILWPGSRRLPKKTVLARLTPEYGHLVEGFPKTRRGDVLEAIGIAVAWSRLTPAQKEKYLVE